MYACSTMYGNVIGPFAPGNSIYNRFSENKETVTPRSGTKRVNYDKIKPNRPAVESRGVAKRAHVPAPEKPLAYNLFGQPKSQQNPAEGQQFTPVPETSEGVLPATEVLPPTEKYDNSSKWGDNPPPLEPVDKGLSYKDVVKTFVSSLGNEPSNITGGKRSEDGDDSGWNFKSGFKTLATEVVKQADIPWGFSHTKYDDNVIGSVPPASYFSGLGDTVASVLGESLKLNTIDGPPPLEPDSFSQVPALADTFRLPRQVPSYEGANFGRPEREPKSYSKYIPTLETIKEYALKKVDFTVSSNGVGPTPKNFGRPNAIPITELGNGILHSGGLKKKPEMTQRGFNGPSSRTRSKKRSTYLKEF